MIPSKDGYDEITFKEFIIYYWEGNIVAEKKSTENKDLWGKMERD